MGTGARVFLVAVIPFLLLPAAGFVAVHKWLLHPPSASASVLVKDVLRDDAGAAQRAIQVSQGRLALKVAGESSRLATLAAELQRSRRPASGSAAGVSLEAVLNEMCNRLRADFLIVSDAQGNPLAGVIRDSGGPGHLRALHGAVPGLPLAGLVRLEETVYIASTVQLGQFGLLSAGEVFDLAQVQLPTVLVSHAQLLKSNLAAANQTGLALALAGCAPGSECRLRLGTTDFVALIPAHAPGTELEVISLRTVESTGPESTAGPTISVLIIVWLALAGVGIPAAFLLSIVVTRCVAGPVQSITALLREGADTGTLRPLEGTSPGLREVTELAVSFNRAARATRESRERLQTAYIEFVAFLAGSLDARDPYTAGHSCRVSLLSCFTAAAMGVPDDELDRIRIGALLHDIGKIGVSDSILNKTGRLTEGELSLIREHPVIGRRILESFNPESFSPESFSHDSASPDGAESAGTFSESTRAEGIDGFAPYLAAVEFHHENWDGSGYPLRQRGEEIPLAARIIHVADAYDAMTTERPQRPCMKHETALRIIRENSGSVFDPLVVRAFTSLSPFQFGSAVQAVPAWEMAGHGAA